MRNSRKYVNPSINASRNIFTSLDSTPSNFFPFPSDITGFSTASTSFTINNINTPILLAFTTSIDTNSNTLEFFKNNRLINSYTVTSRISTNRLLSEYFENGDTITITVSGGLTTNYNLNVRSMTVLLNNLVIPVISVTIPVNLNS